MKGIQQLSKWQTTLLQLRQVNPRVVTRLMGTNVLVRQAQMGETTVTKEGGVTAGAAIVGEAEGTGVVVEGGEGVGILGQIRREVASRKGRWAAGNGSQSF